MFAWNYVKNISTFKQKRTLYEYLEMLKGKFRASPSFKGSIFYNKSLHNLF